jgi:hypothetical protein
LDGSVGHVRDVGRVGEHLDIGTRLVVDLREVDDEPASIRSRTLVGGQVRHREGGKDLGP